MLFSRRGLNPIKLVYDPDRPDGRLSLIASAFIQLSLYTSSPGSGAHAGLAVLPRDAMRKHGTGRRPMSVRLSVCHIGILYRNG